MYSFEMLDELVTCKLLARSRTLEELLSPIVDGLSKGGSKYTPPRVEVDGGRSNGARAVPKRPRAHRADSGQRTVIRPYDAPAEQREAALLTGLAMLGLGVRTEG